MRYFLISLFFISTCLSAQVVTVSPSNPTIFDEITLTFDVQEATDSRADGLLGLTSGVYLWSGAGDDNNAFIYGPDGQTDFSEPVPEGEMTFLGDDVWEIVLTPKSYYNIPDGVEITRLGVLLKNSDGSAQTEDLFIDIEAGEFITFTAPENLSQTQFVSQDEVVTITAESSAIGDLEFFIDEGTGFTSVKTEASTDIISYDYQVGSNVNLKIKVVAIIDSETIQREDSINFFIQEPTTTEALPIGLIEGINYDEADNTLATLVLKAPMKGAVYVVGDFNNWELSSSYQMKRDPDGETYWLEITGLTPQQEYIFQYWIDGIIKVGDPYADKVVDPWNDEFIPDAVYPDLINYDKTQNGMATVLQTAQTPYDWAASEDTWQRPEKEKLVIYELLLRDFLGSHSYDDLIDSLSYLKRLGVNAIELMPIMEFGGNESWGYNPSYFLAPDKYYGTKNDLKHFIETAHQEGFAVILDMVLNHATGDNPYAAMYWDSQNNRPTADNPWFNATATHEFNVFNDFNHESTYTQALVDSVNKYWIEEYHFDGYRFDLSKGFTQQNTIGDVAAWGNYDQSRVDLLTRMADVIWQTDPETYIILEHFADADEEQVLAAEGMLLWRNLNHNYRDALSGNNTAASFNGVNALTHVSYMESHDEERLMYENLEFGQAVGGYNVQELQIALDRVKLGLSFFYTLPGPKMMWQFQELGYDLSINTCSDGITIDDGCRVANKPLPWGDNSLGYYESSERQKLYNTHRAIIDLTNNFNQVFDDGTYDVLLSGNVRRVNIEHPDMDVAIIGNFDLLAGNIDPNFNKVGKWYDYLSGDSIEVDNTNEMISLLPGEFHIYTSEKLDQLPYDTYQVPVPPTFEAIEDKVISENEVLQFNVEINQGTSPLDVVNVTAVSSNQDLIPNTKINITGTGEQRIITFTPNFAQTGTTDITLRASDGIVSSSVVFRITVEEVVTSLNKDLSNYQVYPNPAVGQLNIVNQNSQKLEWELFNYLGEKVELPSESKDNGRIVLDISLVSTGIYYLHIKGNHSKFHRIVINP